MAPNHFSLTPPLAPREATIYNSVARFSFLCSYFVSLSFPPRLRIADPSTLPPALSTSTFRPSVHAATKMASTTSLQGICGDPRCDDRNDQKRQLFFCADCKSCLCDRCWPLQPTHVYSEHEPLKYQAYLQCIRLKTILNTPTSEEDLEELHSQDRNTTWFGESLKLLKTA